MNSLAILSKAAAMLAEATTIQKAKDLKDLALTAGDFARRKKLGREAESHAYYYAIWAEQRMGELLKATEKAKGTDKGGRKRKLDGGRELPSNPPTTLSDLGITKNESSKAQQLAALPKGVVEKIAKGEVRRTAAMRETRRKKARASLKFNGQYRVIYADPPWCYSDKLIEGYGPAEHHYDQLTIKQLCDLKDEKGTHVAKIADKNAVLFLWVTSPLLQECFAVIEAWGFRYKTSFVWDKVRHNMGHYNSVRHEFLLLCTRGSCTPDSNKLHDSVVSIERSRKHSEKPDEFRRIIDQMYARPDGLPDDKNDRIELFGRGHHDGWDVFGDTVQ